MNRHALLLALPLLLVGCPEKEVDDLIEEEEDEDDGGGGVEVGECPEQDLGGAIGRAVAEGQITRQSTRYRYCGGSGGADSGGSDGWGGTGGSSGGGGWDTAPGAPPPDGPDGGGSPGVSFLWTAPSSGSFVFDTCGSGYDTTLGVRAPDCDGETLECNDDWYGLKSRVQVSADAGETYVVVVSGFSGDTGRYTLSIGQGDAAGDCAGDTGWGTTTSTWYGTTGTTGSVTTVWEPPSASVTWGASAVELSVSGGPGAYWFGMAQTDDCEDCWTGEDCIYGYEGGGSTLSYCHDGGDTGTSLSYGGDREALAAGTTAFTDASADGSVTYYLESDWEFGGDGSCYVFGSDTSYYDGLGCTAL